MGGDTLVFGCFSRRLYFLVVGVGGEIICVRARRLWDLGSGFRGRSLPHL